MNPPRSVRITGWGAYAPETVLTNADLAGSSTRPTSEYSEPHRHPGAACRGTS